MDTTEHHPKDELLASYSAGSLPLSQALCISAHLEHCQSCGQKLQRFNSLGSTLLQSLKPAPASADLKARLLDQLDSLVDEPDEQPAYAADSSVPRCLHQFVQSDYTQLEWKRVSPHIHSVELCRDSNGARVELLKIRPGGSASTHTHLGDEYTVILEGSFSDEKGVYRRGDFLMRDPSDQHTPVATKDQECICLAVTEGPIQFTGIFSRMLNPLIRMNYA
jgi:putative transcriptional regulator